MHMIRHEGTLMHLTKLRQVSKGKPLKHRTGVCKLACAGLFDQKIASSMCMEARLTSACKATL